MTTTSAGYAEKSYEFCIIKHVAITALSVVVPEKEINIYDEAEYYGNSVKKIDRMRKMVGFTNAVSVMKT